MTVKSYFANSVASAIRMARAELGEEALLLSTKQAPDGYRQHGAYEVVFGLRNTGAAAAAPAAVSQPADAGTRLSILMLGSLRSQLEDLRDEMKGESRANRSSEAEPENDSWFRGLVESGVDRALAESLVSKAGTEVRSGGRRDSLQALRWEMEELIPKSKQAPLRTGDRNVISFVGPPGAGKSATLLKIAIRWGIARGRKVTVLQLDGQRLGSERIIEHYAALLHCPCRVVAGPKAISRAVRDAGDADLVLVDTPGFSPSESSDLTETAEALAAIPLTETLLVLPATASVKSLSQNTGLYRRFRPDAFVFTRLDEAVDFGSLFSLAVRENLPLSFAGTGQQIPDDVEEFWAAELVRLVLDSNVMKYTEAA